MAVIFYPMQQRLLAKWPNRPTLMALVTLLLKTVLEWRQSSKLNAAEETLT